MFENQKTPLVSVIMIFLNAEKFIQEAIDSVVCQT
jgi:glycosyltransferase involved in cell wall biosynthesis